MSIEFISLFISILSLLVSFTTSYFALIYARKELSSSTFLEHSKMVLDLDKMLIDDPYLWAIYDDHPIRATFKDSPERNAKREAFLYFYLNIYDIVFDFYTHTLRPSMKEKNAWESWQSWMLHLIKNSSQMRRLLQTISDDGKVYPDAFLKEIANLLSKADQS